MPTIFAALLRVAFHRVPDSKQLRDWADPVALVVICLLFVSGCTGVDSGNFAIEHDPNTPKNQLTAFETMLAADMRVGLENHRYQCRESEQMGNEYNARTFYLRCWGAKDSQLFGLWTSTPILEMPRVKVPSESNLTKVRFTVWYGTLMPFGPPSHRQFTDGMAIIRPIVERHASGRSIRYSGRAD